MKPLVLPQINLNGTSRNVLIEQQLDVIRALNILSKALAQAAPNGRDYQTHPAEFAPAREAWMERMQAIDAMRREIERYALAIQES